MTANKFKLFLTSLFVVGIAACVQVTNPTIIPKPVEEKRVETITPLPTFTPTPKFVLPKEPTPTITTPTAPIPTPLPRHTISIAPTVTPTPYRPTPQIKETPPLPIPTSTPENKRKQSKRRVVFVAGLCSTTPKDTFGELTDWLIQDTGFTNSDFDYYNYSLDGRSGATYDENETLKSIDGKDGSAENFRNFLIKLHLVYPSAKFNVVGHSLGGVIALYAIDQYPELHKIVDSVVTVNSPIRGEGLLKLNTARIFTCIVPYEVEHKIPTPALVDVKRDSPVISAIMNADYSKLEGIRIVTLANSNDPVLVSDRYSSGELGTLDDARFKYIYSFGFRPDSPHTAPLKIISLEKSGKKEAAEFMKRALRYAIKGE